MDDRYQPRRDVAEVDLLDGYASKRCPVRVVLDHHPPAGTDPLPTPAAVELRQADGMAHELEIMARLSRLEGAVGIDQSASAADRVSQTAAAMAERAPIIIGAHLADDLAGRRRGRPDVLVQAETAGRYHPLEIKAHRTTRSVDPDGAGPDLAARTSPLDQPWFGASGPHPDQAVLGGRRLTNGLQLAHYHRMLEALGHHSEVPRGGVIGREGTVVWLDLAAPVIPTTWDRSATESLLQRYDMEFSFRLDAIAAESSGEPVVVPVKVHECDTCRWRHHCLPVVEARRCVSTVQGVGYTAWRTYRKMGVDTVGSLAEIHWSSAFVADNWPNDGAELSTVLDEPLTFARIVADTDDPRSELLTSNGFRTVDDLRRFDRRVLLSVGWPTGRLATHIDAARAVELRPDSAILRRGLARLEIPTFDREYDIDMESEVTGQAYLWGIYEAAIDQAEQDVDWSGDPAVAGANAFRSFWARVNRLLDEGEQRGESVGFFCWHDEAEKGALRRGAALAAEVLGHRDAPGEVEAFIERDILVDLCQIARRDLVTGGSKSLKAMAPKAGFAWRDDEPDGAASMVWHQHAVDLTLDEPTRQQWRTRLLAYNEDDVRAEAAVRDWMRSTSFSAAADLD